MKFDFLIEEYLLNKVDAETLKNSIKQYFKKLLNEYKFREIEYLKFYPFISELQDDELYREDVLRGKISEIKDILYGQKAFIYDVWMNLSKSNISPIDRVWSEFKEKGCVSFTNNEILQEELNNISIKTIEDLCREKLLTLMVGLPIVDDFLTYNLLYVKEITLNVISEDIERLIDVLTGKRPVHLLLKYNNNDFIYMVLW